MYTNLSELIILITHTQFVSSVHVHTHSHMTHGLLTLLHGTAWCTRTVISAGGERGNPRGRGHVLRAVHGSTSAVLGGAVWSPRLGGLWDHRTGCGRVVIAGASGGRRVRIRL